MVAHVRDDGIEVGRKGGGELKRMEGGGWEVRVVRPRQPWEDRGGCEFILILGSRGRSAEQSLTNGIVSPLALLKNPMILIAVVGFGFVFGMPYLLDSSTCAYSPPFVHIFYPHPAVLPLWFIYVFIYSPHPSPNALSAKAFLF